QYQSLHLSVPFVVEQFGEKKVRFIEVQIRTPEMQERCENGDLAHALYKQSKIDKEKLLLMAKYATTLRNASTEEAQMLAFNLRPDRIFVKVMQSGIVKEVDLQENSCIFDLICKVSDPFFVHKVISPSTSRLYSMYELVNPNYEYFIEKTNEKTSPATINNIIPRCSLETRMNLEYELNKRK
ncbi:MAG: hypothetical protein N3G76_02650, partial [Candidatus Micrarchaeota archaeon]|nr:hypothetical protein [Candidatus Micrarchaeota archaeon]